MTRKEIDMAEKKDQVERLVSLTIRVSVPVVSVQEADDLEQVIAELVKSLDNVRYDATRSIPRPGRE